MSEELGRSVGFKKKAKKAKRTRPLPEFFKPPEGTTDVSVDRLSLDGSVLQGIAQERHANRNQTMCGWAVVKAAKAQDNGRRVRESPCDSNPFHADISLPASILDDEASLKLMTQQLADLASWRDTDPPIVTDTD